MKRVIQYIKDRNNYSIITYHTEDKYDDEHVLMIMKSIV